MLLSRVLRHDTLQSIPFSVNIINKCNLSGANHALKPCRIAAGHICFIHFVVCIELKSCMMSLFNQIYFSAFCSPMEIENPCSIGFFITEIQRNNIDFTSIIKTKPTAMTFRYDIANLCNICDLPIVISITQGFTSIPKAKS